MFITAETLIRLLACWWYLYFGGQVFSLTQVHHNSTCRETPRFCSIEAR